MSQSGGKEPSVKCTSPHGMGSKTVQGPPGRRRCARQQLESSYSACSQDPGFPEETQAFLKRHKFITGKPRLADSQPTSSIHIRSPTRGKFTTFPAPASPTPSPAGTFAALAAPFLRGCPAHPGLRSGLSYNFSARCLALTSGTSHTQLCTMSKTSWVLKLPFFSENRQHF